MQYVAHVLPATAQLGAVLLPWLGPSVPPLLMLNKLNHIEFRASPSAWSTPEDHYLLYDISLHGTIASWTSLTLPSTSQVALLVLTTDANLFLLTHDASLPSPHVSTVSSVSLHEEHARPAELQTVIVDAQQKCIIVHSYNGLLRVIPLPSPASKKNKVDLSKGYNLRLPQLNLTSLTFLPSTPTSADEQDIAEDPTIGLIALDPSGNPVLHTHTISLPEKDLLLGPIPSARRLVDPGAEILIPVPAPKAGDEQGLIVVGEEWISWVALASGKASGERDEDDPSPNKGKGKGKRRSSSSASTSVATSSVLAQHEVGVKTPVGAVKAWAPLMDQPDQYLLGDLYGKLSHLTLSRSSSGRVVSMTLADLGDTSSPTAILPLTPSHIYVASRFADSQFVQLPSSVSPPSVTEHGMDVEGNGEMELLASIASLSPVLDCVLVGQEGNTSIVTCSGAYKGGSLRVVRQGVGLSELANLDVENIRQMWALKQSDGNDLLVLGQFTETKILGFPSPSLDDGDDEEDAIEEVDLPHFDTSSPTVFAACLNDGATLAQVTRIEVRYGEGRIWTPEDGKKITEAGKVDENGLVLALEGGIVILLALDSEGRLNSVGTTTLPNEIASLSTSTYASQPVVVLGLWTSQTVHILSLPFFTPLTSVAVPTTYLIRSALLTTFADSVSHLFVGLGDGTLVSYLVEEGGVVKDGSEKSVMLGRTPIFMTPFTSGRDGEAVSVFVSSDRPTIVSRSGDRLKYSSVNLKGISAAVPFTSAAFPSSLALATSTTLRIGRIEDIQSVDIRTIPLGDDEPRRIAYDASNDTFGVVCLRREIDRKSGAQEVSGSFKVFDGKSFEVLANVAFGEDEQGESVTVISAADDRTGFAVGTSRVVASDAEPSSGRLLVVAAKDAARQFELVSEHEINGCPYAVAALVQNYVAAAIQSQVIAYSISPDFKLKPIATWSGKFISLTLTPCADSQLLVGDGIGSLALLRFSPASPSATKLEEVSRDHRTLYIAAAAPLDGDEFIGAEAEMNLFTVQNEDVTTSRSMSDERALSPRGVFHLGELVSKFCPGSFVQQYGDASGVATPRLVFATSAGSLGIVAQVDKASSKVLAELERNMRPVVASIGDLSQEEWRAFKSEAKTLPSVGFLDGNFLELFATLLPTQVETVLAGQSEHEKVSSNGSELLKLIEELARLH